jgi:hypothetical protein
MLETFSTAIFLLPFLSLPGKEKGIAIIEVDREEGSSQ